MLDGRGAVVAGAAAGAPDGELSPLLNLGSSDLHFRTEAQPWIDREVFAPLRAPAGREIVHSDLKTLPGVDIAADALSEAGLSRLRAVGARAILCCNMLEQRDRPGGAGASAWRRWCPVGGLLVVTVPFSYPYHPDPIDTYYRPDPEDMSRELFPGLRLVRAEIVDGPTYAPELLRRPWLLVRDLRKLAGLRDSPSGARARACAGRVALSGQLRGAAAGVEDVGARGAGPRQPEPGVGRHGDRADGRARRRYQGGAAGDLDQPRGVRVATLALAAIPILDLATELGLPGALVQQGDHTPARLSTVFWLNLLLSLTIVAAIFFAVAPLLASHYKAPIVGWMLQAHCVKLLLQNSVHGAGGADDPRDALPRVLADPLPRQRGRERGACWSRRRWWGSGASSPGRSAALW